MNRTEFVAKLVDIATNYKTKYLYGVFGSPVTESVISQKAKQYPSWYTAARQAEYRALIGKGYFGFDCVNLIKGILWGWSGDTTKTYGGAAYVSNGVPDINADGMFNRCTGKSSVFKDIPIGAALWCSGHIGIYIGDGKGVECTPAFAGDVQITAVGNMGAISGLATRTWTKWGLLPYFDYSDAVVAPPVADNTGTVLPMNGMDVSKYQGVIDWDKVKASGRVDFAILRAVSTSKAKGGIYVDDYFERNYKEAKRVGIPVGCYLYSYATTTAAAQVEARFLLDTIKGKQFELPVWFDQEYEPGILALTKAQRTAIVKTFCGTMEAAGYYCGLYASTNFINTLLDYEQLRSYDVWAAQYGPACTVKLPYGVWQTSSSGTIPGISGNVDTNIAYKDYPTIIKGAGLNGYTKGETGQEPGTGEDAGQDKVPEGEITEPITVTETRYRLDIDLMSIGDCRAFEQLASSLGLGVTVEVVQVEV